ncbi:hypothetical protein O3P69_012302 [Scylla paramamosain]|uniref:Uncharacterized protein n=1 Tax=Scylla paramamosain TaxID=85552 RepID=A0AAW0TDH2_SCYPA
MDGWKCLASFSSTSRQQLRRQRRVLPLYTQHLTPWELQRKLPSRLAAFPHFHLPSFPASSAFSPVSPRVSRCREGGKDKKYGGKSHTLEGSNGHRSTRRCPVDRVASPSRPAASYHGRLPVYTTQHPGS